jgi:hypothetical protein
LKPVGFYEVVGTLPPDSIDSKATSGSGSLKDGIAEWFDAAPYRGTWAEAITLLVVIVAVIVSITVILVVANRKSGYGLKPAYKRHLSKNEG